MKKSVIALAVMAVSGVAFAQSSVTLYGTVDASIGAKKVNGLTQTLVSDGDELGLSGSSFGFKGTEDLGGGLKANFVFEQNFSVDRGNARDSWGSALTTPQPTGNQMFGNQAFVGFSGGFGTLELGKSYTAYDRINGRAHPAFDSAFKPVNDVWSGSYKFSPGNTIFYATPDLGGFSGAVSYSLGENKTSTLAASKVTSFHIKYEGGPLYVGLGYQRDSIRGPGAVVAGVFVPPVPNPMLNVNNTRLNATYDFGVVKLLAAYGRLTTNINNLRATDWSLGADVPLSTAASISFGFARSTDNGPAGGYRAAGFGLAGIYSLSKRTDLYAGVRTANSRNFNNGPETKTSLYGVGVRHKF